MKLRKLALENFRNYEQYQYEFDLTKDFTILIGENGQGKTNFLEAVYLLSLGRSFRSPFQGDLIQWEKDYFRCKGETSSESEDEELEVFYSKQPTKTKNFKKNGVNLKNSEYLGSLITVLFHPEDIDMLYKSPSLRRKYLDIVLSQTDKKYLQALSSYRKVLKQRNALLNGFSKTHKDLDIWDEEISQFGQEIIKKRHKYIKFLNERLTAIYQSISDYQSTSVNADQVDVEYSSTIKNDYLEELSARRQHDLDRRETTLGPHRDDLKFYLNDKKITAIASRGEYRTLLLAIKLAEINYIQEKTGQNPVLLLDDVFSELDHKRQKGLLKAIKGCQTIITATDLSEAGELAKNAEIILCE